MKKKIIYGLLLAVAMVTASSSFVSCKDYEGDDYAHWQEQLAANEFNDKKSLQDLIEFQIHTLRYELENALGNGNNIYDNTKSYTNAEIRALLAQLDAIENEYNSKKNNGSISDFLKIMNDLNKLASDAAPKVNDSLKYIRFSWGGSLKKAYDSAMWARLKALDNAYRIDTLTARGDSLYKVINEKADSLYDRATFLADSNLHVLDSILNEKVDSIADTLLVLILKNADSIRINAQNIYNDSILFDSLITKVNIRVTNDSILFDSLNTATNDRVDSLAQVTKAIEARLLGYAWEPIYDKYPNGDYKLDNLGHKIIKGWKANTTKVTTLDELAKVALDADKILQGEIDNLKEHINDLQSQIDNILGTLKKLITGIIVQGTYNPVFGTLAVPLNTQSNVLAAFVGKSDQSGDFPTYDPIMYINEASIISEQEYNLMYETGGLPDEIYDVPAQSTLISDAEDNAGKLYLTVNPSNIDFTGTEFTLRGSGNHVSKVTLSDLKKSDKELTFGYTRAAIADESSNGFYEASVKVSAEAAAAVAPNFKYDMKNMAKDVYTILRDGYKERKVNLQSVAELASKVYANSSDVLPRLGVQAEWTDEQGDAKSVVSQYSIAATAIKPLGFKVIKADELPFTYPTNHQWIKYINGRAIDNRIWDMIQENLQLDLNLKLNINFDSLKISGVTYDPLSSVTVPVEITDAWLFLNADNRYELVVCDDNGNALKDADGNYITAGVYALANRTDGTLGGSFKVVSTNSEGTLYYVQKSTVVLDLTEYTNQILYGKDEDGDGIRESGGVYNNINDVLLTFRTNLDKFNGQIDNINSIDEKVQEAVNDAINKMGINLSTQLSDLINDYVGKINKYIRKGNSYINKVINNAEYALQPVLLSYDSNKKLSRMSSTQYAPKVVKLNGQADAVIALQPTTMNLEIVSPAFKKHLAISNVIHSSGTVSALGGDAASKEIMKKANASLKANEVFEGIHALRTLTVDSSMKGYILEVVYTALDYNGQISGKKYYIYVTD